jgi:hypothetical protein
MALIRNEILSNAVDRNLSSSIASASTETIQKLANLVVALMGPAVLSVYAFSVWALTAEMGWTNSFPFAAGPLSNWIIWTLMAVLSHFTFITLQRQLKLV